MVAAKGLNYPLYGVILYDLYHEKPTHLMSRLQGGPCP